MEGSTMAASASERQVRDYSKIQAGKEVDILQPVLISRLREATVEIPIIGTAPLIPHRWSEKARRMMLDKQQQKVAEKKPPKDPFKEAVDSCYWIRAEQVGMPTTAFKAALVGAATFFDK